MKAAITDFLISMCILAVVFLAMALDANAAEVNDSGTTISLTAEEAQNCDDEGSCFLMTQKTAEAIIEYMRAMKESKESCGKQI